MTKDPKLGRPSRLEENDQEESKLAKSNHFLPRKLLIDGNKAYFVVYVSNEISLSGLNKMYPFRIASNHWVDLVAVQDWDVA